MVTQKLRDIGGIINSTDLNYNFDRMQEDLQLAVEGVIFKEPYAQLENIADRNAIPESERKPGLWVAVSENGFVYEWNVKDDVIVSDERRQFGINAGDLPDVPYRIDGDATSGVLYNALYVCECDSRDADWKYTSVTTGETYNDGDWAVFKKADYEQDGHWIRIPKWIPIMNVTSILENNIIGKLEDLHTEDKYRIVNAINEIHDDLGTLDDLTTNTKVTAVAAINELDDRCGELPDLTTRTQANLVAAIDELDADLGPVEDMTTTNKGNAVLAINELHSEHGELSDLHTADKTTFVNAINEVQDELGDIATLTTDTKATAVDAINELDDRCGELKDLTTDAKNNLVSAVNEVDAHVGPIENLTTANKANATVAINELDKEMGDLSGLHTEKKDNMVNALNEVHDDLGTLTDLTTTNKSTAVAAINELDGEIGPLNTLTTTDKSTIVKAINELDKDLGAPADLTTTAKANTVAAINELKAITDTLRGATIVIGRINEDTKDVTEAKLTTRALAIMGGTTVQTGWTLVDNEQHEWHWNGSNWQDMEQPNIYPAQNGTLGTVRGNATGDISVTDGNMTVLHAANASKLGDQLPSYYAKSADLGTVSSLTTTAKTAVGAINEHDAEIGTITNLTTTNKTNLVSAINELDSDVGSLTNLTTTNKSNIISAINEVKAQVNANDTDNQDLHDKKADKTNVLELDNTTAYEPTADYHPATKAYVDSLTGGASWGEIVNNIEDQEDLMDLMNDRPTKNQVLTKTNTTAYTPSNNYHPATKKYVDDVFSRVNGWGQIQGDIADQQDLQNEFLTKQDKATAWNTTNLVVSTTQPAVPTEGYIVWIDLNS